MKKVMKALNEKSINKELINKNIIDDFNKFGIAFTKRVSGKSESKNKVFK